MSNDTGRTGLFVGFHRLSTLERACGEVDEVVIIIYSIGL